MNEDEDIELTNEDIGEIIDIISGDGMYRYKKTCRWFHSRT